MPLGQKHGTTSENKAAETAKDNISVSSDSDSENGEWMSKDPGDLLHTESTEGTTACSNGKSNMKVTVTEPESDVMVGLVFRKKTTPSLPGKRPSSDSANNLFGGVNNVIKKTSDMMYMVNCGVRGSNQVIHVDRMRLKRSQLLVGETLAGVQEPRDDRGRNNDQVCSDVANVTKTKCDSDSFVTDGENSNEIGSENKEELPERQFRCRRPPLWLKDYETDY
jgi:hypothetical protein